MRRLSFGLGLPAFGLGSGLGSGLTSSGRSASESQEPSGHFHLRVSRLVELDRP
jgi:hypothetical protein